MNNMNVKITKVVKLRKFIALMIGLIIYSSSLAQCNAVAQLDLQFNGNALDSSPNNNDGLVIGASLVQDRFGNSNSAYYFSGGDMIEIDEAPSFQPNFPLSLSMWIWVDSTAGAQTPFFSNEDNPNRFCGIWLDVLNDNIFVSFGNGQAGFSLNNLKTFSGTTVVTREQWHHVCVVAKSATDIDIYLDGALETINTNGNASSMGYVAATWNASIGTERGQFFKGAIDDVKLFDDTLCINEINGLYTPGTDNTPFCNPTSGVDVQSACESFTWIDGNTYTSDNSSATHTLATQQGGCDSVVTLNLTIYSGTSGTDVVTGCGSYTWIDGNTYTTDNNSATFMLTNSFGCDSLVTLDLTFENVNTAVTQSGIVLSANEPVATYQWLNCPAMTSINGATDQSYTATANGEYAVIVTTNNCSDTSNCFLVDEVGIDELTGQNEWHAFPNPTKGKLTIELKEPSANYQLEIQDLNGNTLVRRNGIYGKSEIDISNVASGVYFLRVYGMDRMFSKKIIVL
ncbi:MAG: hypothetical protein Crog4KO_13370 [Crocinitomicaceae bacterium]